MSFLVILTAVILVLLPITDSVYDFATDKKLDKFTVETGAAEVTGNATLFKAVYENDTSTIDLTSSDSDDAPLFSSYNTTTRFLSFSGLAVSTNRTISVEYDVAAMSGIDAILTLFDISPFLYYAIILGFVVGSIAAIFTGRA